MFTFHISAFWYQGARVGAHQKPLSVRRGAAIYCCRSRKSSPSKTVLLLLRLFLPSSSPPSHLLLPLLSRKPLPHSSSLFSLFSFKTNTTQTRSQSPLHMRFSATTHTFLLSSLCHSSSPLPLTTSFFSLRYARNPFCTLFFHRAQNKTENCRTN